MVCIVGEILFAVYYSSTIVDGDVVVHDAVNMLIIYKKTRLDGSDCIIAFFYLCFLVFLGLRCFSEPMSGVNKIFTKYYFVCIDIPTSATFSKIARLVSQLPVSFHSHMLKMFTQHAAIHPLNIANILSSTNFALDCRHDCLCHPEHTNTSTPCFFTVYAHICVVRKQLIGFLEGAVSNEHVSKFGFSTSRKIPTVQRSRKMMNRVPTKSILDMLESWRRHCRDNDIPLEGLDQNKSLTGNEGCKEKKTPMCTVLLKDRK